MEANEQWPTLILTRAVPTARTRTEKRMRDWIDFELVGAFAAEGTAAYRLCTKPDCWVERYGPDALVSYKTEAALEQILPELEEWALLVESAVRARLRALFAETKCGA